MYACMYTGNELELTCPFSSRLHNITTTVHSLSFTTFQKSLAVLSMGFWATMNAFLCLYPFKIIINFLIIIFKTFKNYIDKCGMYVVRKYSLQLNTMFISCGNENSPLHACLGSANHDQLLKLKLYFEKKLVFTGYFTYEEETSLNGSCSYSVLLSVPLLHWD